MRTFKIQKLSNGLGLEFPYDIITDGLNLIGRLFGGGGKGSDFPQRRAQFQSWLSKFGFMGADARFLDNDLLQSMLFDDYGRYGQPWQDNIQAYLQQTRDYLNLNKINVYGTNHNFSNDIIIYVDSIRGTPGANGKIKVPVISGIISAGASNPIFLLLLAGAGVYFLTSSKPKRRRK